MDVGRFDRPVPSLMTPRATGVHLQGPCHLQLVCCLRLDLQACEGSLDQGFDGTPVEHPAAQLAVHDHSDWPIAF